MKIMILTDSKSFFIEYLSDDGELLFYWEPEHTPTMEELIKYGEHTHSVMMNYPEYRRANKVYPWT